MDLRHLVQEARRRKIRVSQEELDEAIGALRHRFGDLKDFGGWIQQQGIGEPGLFETLRADMLAQRATAAIVEGVRITEEQMREHFEAHRDDLVIGAEVRLRIIAVTELTEADETMRPGEARNADVLPGQNGFKTPHLGHSIGPNATLIFNVELVAIRPRMKEES